MYIYVRAYACTLIYNTYGVGYGVAVCYERQYQSLYMRNSKIAVPLYLCKYVCGSSIAKVRFFVYINKTNQFIINEGQPS